MTKAPWHFWVVAVLAVLWNAFGAVDYVLTQLGNEAYLARLTAEERAYLASLPFGEEVIWAVGVWAALIASLFLIFRSRKALPAFLLSLVGIAGMLLYTFVLNRQSAETLAKQIPFSATITGVALLLTAYTVWMKRKGVLA